MEKRNRLQILALILEIANGNRVKRSKIVQKTYLSHSCLTRYLPFLLERDLIQYKGDDRTYITTYKGLHFLQVYNKIDELVNHKSLSRINLRQSYAVIQDMRKSINAEEK